MQTVFDNLINGNLKDARKGARRFSQSSLFGFAVGFCGWSDVKAYAAALYLKTGEGFQRFCDAD